MLLPLIRYVQLDAQVAEIVLASLAAAAAAVVACKSQLEVDTAITSVVCG